MITQRIAAGAPPKAPAIPGTPPRERARRGKHVVARGAERHEQRAERRQEDGHWASIRATGAAAYTTGPCPTRSAGWSSGPPRPWRPRGGAAPAWGAAPLWGR